MSESEDSGPGRREVAHRLFAAEFDDSEFSYSESDEERAPNYVVTPTGARVNRLFVVGVLTELEQVNDDVLRARIVDPTGPFVVYAGQYQPEALAFLEAATPPLFVAITGKARTFEPDDGDRVFTSIRPESISEVDAETRDRWVVQAAQQTIDRVGRMAGAKASALSGDDLRGSLATAGVADGDAAGITLALDYYGTTGEYLHAVRELATNCARVVTGDRDEAGSLSMVPDDGTDGPLSALSTLDLDAGTSDGESVSDGQPTPGDDAPAEPATADEQPTEPDAGSTESVTAAETDAGGGDREPAETVSGSASSGGEIESSKETTAEPTAASTESTPRDEASEPAETTTAADETKETHEGDSGSLGDFEPSDSSAGESIDGEPAAESEADDDVGEFDTEFELDEDEREEIEQEYGTEFQSGTEVDDAGQADIETPDPDELAEAEAVDPNETADAESEATAAGDSEPEPPVADSDDEAAAEASADVDLEDAVMAAMQDLDDGSGADREAVRSAVVEEYAADADAVEDAIQDALMGGRCYEPEDGKLTPI